MSSTLSFNHISQVISRNRSSLMGVAIIWVILYHIKIHTGFFPVDVVCRTGFAGVDIFLFVSGFGLFLSLEQKSDTNSFYFRRAKRILPTYWTVLLLLVIIGMSCTIEYLSNPLDALTAMFGISFWIGDNGGYSYWYAALIITFYLVYPIIHSCIKRNVAGTMIGVSALSLLGSILFYYIYCTCNGQETWVQIFAITRLPIFTLGAVLSYLSRQNAVLAKHHRWGIVILSLVGLVMFCVMPYLFSDSLLKKGGLYFLPPLLFTPALCYWLAVMFEKAGKRLNAIFASLGSISFELYLAHVAIFDIFLFRATSWPRPVYVSVLVAASLAMAYLLKHTIKFITSLTTPKAS